MRFKEGVVLALRPQMASALPNIDRVHLDTVQREAIITSGTDGRHRVDSLHYVGLAIDLRTHDLDMGRIIALASALKLALGKDFDVVIEGDHIHVEYDPE